MQDFHPMKPPRAALPTLAMTLLAVAAAACAGAGASTTPTAPADSASPEPTRPATTATPMPTSEPTPRPGGLADFGAHATVVVDRLNVRITPSTDLEPITTLAAGEDLLLVDGPLVAGDYVWYEVHSASITQAGIQGWVAALPADMESNPPDDAWLIDIGPVRCPEADAIDTALLATMTGYAIDQCAVQVEEVGGLVDLCFEGPITPYTYSPSWLWFSCYFVRAEQGGWYLPVYFPPDFSGDMPERGDIVTVTGRMGYDTERYGQCLVTAGEDFPPAQLETEQHLFANSCHRKFVVSAVEITGHVELPPMY
jgi:hypothetical protein